MSGFKRLSLTSCAILLSLSTVAYAEDIEPAYTFTRVDSKGENTITKFEWNSELNKMVPIYYRVDLNQTEYGSGDGVKYFKWDKTDKLKLVETTNPAEAEITAKYDTTKLQNRLKNTTDNSATNIEGGSFVNQTTGRSGDQCGGAIYNKGSSAKLGDINADFVGNYASGEYDEGGAIYNSVGTIGDITGDFIGNYAAASGEYAEALGGAIYNYRGTIGDITGDFISNYASGDYASGGAISNYDGTIGDITGNFIGNYAAASGEYAEALGGAIYNYRGTIGDITGDFIGNYAAGNYAAGKDARGGAISNYRGTIGDITGDFIGNYTSGKSAEGGAISNEYGTIGDITGDFISNYASGDYASGGAISNYDGTIGDITGDFIGNYAAASGEYADAAGGAICNIYGTIGQTTPDGNIMPDSGIVNSSFINNYASANGENGFAMGGAIMTTDLNIVAKDGYTSVFSGNYTEANGVKDDNAITVMGIPQGGGGEEEPMNVSAPTQPFMTGTLNFEMQNGGKFVMADNIRGVTINPNAASPQDRFLPSEYNVNITGDNIDNTTFYMLNDMYDANLSVGQTTLNTINDSVHTYGLNTFTLTNDIKLAVDVDLAHSEMDRYTANNYGQHQGNLTVSGMNLISDSTGEHTEILFAEQGLKDNVLNGTGELPDKYQTAYTPIYKYNVSYDNRADGGYFLFDRGGMNGNSSESFNPSVLSTPVSNQAGSQAVINETVRFAFQHMDLFSQLPFHQRMAIINNNRYAGVNNGVNNGVNAISASRYDVRTDTPQYNSEFEMINKGFWVKPFTSFETINLNNGPDVDAITYGTLVGFDSNFKELKRGWYNVQSIYGGYNGSQLSYDGVDTTLNGGVLGLTETFYKGNFFTALTATAGANVGSSKTMYGNEDFTALLAGIGSKSGYNFEFKNGKYILQPILFMNYSFVNTFDYTNAAGVKIDSAPLHTFQINPQLKFISNLKNGWQPYASVGMVWNVLNSSKVRANDVILPKMSVDPYVEYGVGLQRNWKDRFTGFAQAMVRNGGRNGVALTFGFRWAIGKGDDL